MTSRDSLAQAITLGTLAAALMFAVACNKDLGLESKSWPCSEDSECPGDQVCVGTEANSAGRCVAADTTDADDAADTANEDNDNDGVLNPDDNCPDVPNPGQINTDSDQVGDACDRERPLTSASVVVAGSPGARLGAAIAGGRQVIGTGLSDMIVGAPGSDRAHVVEGNSAGNVTVPATGTLLLPNEERTGDGFGSNIALIGRYLGEQWDDFVIQARDASPPYLEGYSKDGAELKARTTLTNPGSTNVGGGVGWANDFDEVPGPDVLVGDPSSNSLFLISSAQQDKDIFNGGRELTRFAEFNGQTDDRLGEAIASLGPLGTSGSDFVAVGAPGRERVYILRYPTGEFENGRVLGDLIVTEIVVTSVGVVADFGAALAAIDDVTGDNITDLAVGQPLEDGGRVLIFDGASLTNNTPLSEGDAVIIIESEASGDEFGSTITAVGDIDNDNSIDILIGSPGASPGSAGETGAAYLMPGRALNAQSSPISASEGIAFHGEAAGARAGEAVAWLEDFNGDGESDFAVGAPGTASGDGALYVVFGPLSYGPQDD